MQSKMILIPRCIPTDYDPFVLNSTFILSNNLLAAPSHQKKSKCKYTNVIGLQHMKVESIERLVESFVQCLKRHRWAMRQIKYTE